MANGRKRIIRTAIVASVAILTTSVIGGVIPSIFAVTVPVINTAISVGGVASLGVGIYLGELAADKLNVKD